jgi:hypothetical protein
VQDEGHGQESEAAGCGGRLIAGNSVHRQRYQRGDGDGGGEGDSPPVPEPRAEDPHEGCLQQHEKGRVVGDDVGRFREIGRVDVLKVCEPRRLVEEWTLAVVEGVREGEGSEAVPHEERGCPSPREQEGRRRHPEQYPLRRRCGSPARVACHTSAEGVTREPCEYASPEGQEQDHGR